MRAVVAMRVRRFDSRRRHLDGTLRVMSDESPQSPPTSDRRRPEEFWTVGTTAMTREEAEEAAQLIATRYVEVHAHAVDPRSFMTLGLDRWTAEMVRNAVARLDALGGDVGGVLELVDEFLAIAYPYAEDEEGWPGLP